MQEEIKEIIKSNDNIDQDVINYISQIISQEIETSNVKDLQDLVNNMTEEAINVMEIKKHLITKNLLKEANVQEINEKKEERLKNMREYAEKKPVIIPTINKNEKNETIVLSKKELRKQKRKEKKKAKQEFSYEDDLKELDDFDDHASSWEKCRKENRSWGGKSFGGRGISKIKSNALQDSIALKQLTLQFNELKLLEESDLTIVKGHRYGLIGNNGVGKSVLLKAMLLKKLPNFPLDVFTYYVEQELKASDDIVLEAVIKCAPRESEYDLQNEYDKDLEVKEIEQEAKKILSFLGVKKSMLLLKINQLSGGYRMRVGLAQALISKCDLLLLDEPESHLDLIGIRKLEEYLTKDSQQQHHHNTLIVVSHDRTFLSNVCTDLIVFKDKKLSQFPSNYQDYIQREQEKQIAANVRYENTMKQRKKKEQKIQKAKMQMNQSSSSKNKNDKQLKQQKQVLKKLERIGLHRDDGKKYKTKSLSKLSEDALRLPSVATPYVMDSDLKFVFPDPDTLIHNPHIPLISMENVSCGYNTNSIVVTNVTLSVYQHSRIALIGRNGVGKSTLFKLLLGNDSQVTTSKGTISRNNLKIEYMAQHHVDSLKDYLEITCVELFKIKYPIKFNETKVRRLLGNFGIYGKLVKLPIRKLSGGLKSRVVFALIFYNNPDLILFDEPQNGLSIRSREALEFGLQHYNGAFIIISHDVSLIENICTELWTINSKTKEFKIQLPQPLELIETSYKDLHQQDKDDIKESFQDELLNQIENMLNNKL